MNGLGVQPFLSATWSPGRAAALTPHAWSAWTWAIRPRTSRRSAGVRPLPPFARSASRRSRSAGLVVVPPQYRPGPGAVSVRPIRR
ncbi:hypothetical protein HD595_001307 [Nonomuraea roseoviolacea subsp. carminata]|uniref:Uncharacterized protein n=1 Tax=Nonomuraea roseoviolacea subsp. carminata TaxID=160689 RepID=A0ABT1JTY8_9ACTN|nr:hypothetical protein [Nonomuraea roseoviolacea]MCP2345185.1 hypothetical protein [Nonomuraea roseoviolacea subsp. carminata]